MRDISDNRYLKFYNSEWRDYSLNTYLFREYVERKDVPISKLYFDLFNLMSLLRFNIHLSGTKYLTKLVQMYLVNNEYTEEWAISRISQMYGVFPSSVIVNVKDVIRLNKSFKSVAENLLHAHVDLSDDNYSEAVEIIAAIFTVHYNYNVVGEQETEADKLKMVNINEIFS